MKLVEVMFKLNEKLPTWQEQLLDFGPPPLHTQASEPGQRPRLWMTFVVNDDFEVPE